MTTNSNYEAIIKKIFSEQIQSPQEIEILFPSRNLEKNSMVTRIAPSPTGFMHFGGLYTALISERLAHQSNGVFYLRIEDTDKAREIEGACDIIIQALKNYGINIDEGIDITGNTIGNYGPYKQSLRSNIYKSFIVELIKKGTAYPCFCSPKELEEIRKTQMSTGIRTGYYGDWAVWRNKSEKEALKALDEGKKCVIRFKSNGNNDRKILVPDLLKGTRELSENDQDIIILKSDDLPTYHFAHVVDDHLMRTTHVFRGDEWYPSLPLHIQLFNALNWRCPQYGHLSPIQKIENNSKRKLSKRKDPEANIQYYDKNGYPKEAIIEYLLNLANSNFEDWRKLNPQRPNNEFILTLNKLSKTSGALLDLSKLNNISKEIISNFSAKEIYEKSLKWAEKHVPELLEILQKNELYIIKIFDIERGNTDKTRKDLSKWSDIWGDIEYFFDDYFHQTPQNTKALLSEIDPQIIKNIVKLFLESYNEIDSKDEWFSKIKQISQINGFATNNNLFKTNPENYKGNVADVAKIFRVLLTGRTQTPDLYSIMKVMGKNRVLNRLNTIEKL